MLRPHRRLALDGDTLEVLHNQHPERIRLSGIDCPEKSQAFGKRAKQAASELVYGKVKVTLQTHGKDKYTRTIGDVLLPDGTNLNQELVKQGWCWWYRKLALVSVFPPLPRWHRLRIGPQAVLRPSCASFSNCSSTVSPGASYRAQAAKARSQAASVAEEA